MDTLPIEILVHINSFLDLKSIYSFNLINKLSIEIAKYTKQILYKKIISKVVHHKGWYQCLDKNIEKERCPAIINKRTICTNRKINHSNTCARHRFDTPKAVKYSYKQELITICNRLKISSTRLLDLTKNIWQDEYGNEKIIMITNPSLLYPYTFKHY